MTSPSVQVGMGLYAFRLGKESPRPLWTLPLQQFVYRQLMYLVVIQSVVTALAGTRLRRQRMERHGSLTVPPPTPPPPPMMSDASGRDGGTYR
ncbi:hypothetical protein [Actinacidiphila acididurans]|uniref:hypothetical protein n=1 Tax=Actinacidiphila acididurans TaxID=2784346 RepID=UPI0027DCF1DE|nr:hypothetical protein [Actinacidiphila acididurans]